MTVAKRAFITGLTGQDGSYLAELLLEKGYEVHGIVRRASVFTTDRIDHILEHPNVFTYHGDMSDSSNLNRLLQKVQPHEIYNLAAQSHVAVSFEVPEYTAEVDAIGAIRLLDAIRDLGLPSRFYQASTSELFGGAPDTVPQSEATPFRPRSPYGAAKLYAYWITVNYREAYGMYACNGVLFNHESPRRGETFVTRKITRHVASVHNSGAPVLKLGNLDAMRDWGYAKDYVECMWLMLQQDEPKDYVIATGKAYSVRQFVEMAYGHIGRKIVWDGAGVDEKGRDAATGELLVEIDPRYFRPTEVDFLLGDASKAEAELGWKNSTPIEELVRIMMEHDLQNPPIRRN
jgi:GDPmannose 4,6-dehydratase